MLLFSEELAWSKGEPDEAVQGKFGVLTKVKIPSPQRQRGRKGWPLYIQAFMKQSRKEGENF